MAPKVGKWAVSTKGKQTQSINNGEVNCKNSYYDKQSGSYGRVTTKESVSSGDYTNRGRSGHKDEYKAKSTVRVGDKRGYTEYSKEEKLTRVDYGGGSNNYDGNKLCWGGGYSVDRGYSSDDCGVDSNEADDDDSPDVDVSDDDDVCFSDGGNSDDDFNNDDVGCSDDCYDSDDGGCSDDCYDSDDGGCSDDYYDSDDY